MWICLKKFRLAVTGEAGQTEPTGEEEERVSRREEPRRTGGERESESAEWRDGQ